MNTKKAVDNSGTRVVRRTVREDGLVIEHVASNHPATRPARRSSRRSHGVASFLEELRRMRGNDSKPGPF